MLETALSASCAFSLSPSSMAATVRLSAVRTVLRFAELRWLRRAF